MFSEVSCHSRLSPQAVPTAEKLTKEQLQPGAQQAADTLNQGAERLTQEIIQPEAKQLAEQVPTQVYAQFTSSIRTCTSQRPLQYVGPTCL